MVMCSDLSPQICRHVLPTGIVHQSVTSVTGKHDEEFTAFSYPMVSKTVTGTCFVKPEKYECA